MRCALAGRPGFWAVWSRRHPLWGRSCAASVGATVSWTVSRELLSRAWSAGAGRRVADHDLDSTICEYLPERANEGARHHGLHRTAGIRCCRGRRHRRDGPARDAPTPPAALDTSCGRRWVGSTPEPVTAGRQRLLHPCRGVRLPICPLLHHLSLRELIEAIPETWTPYWMEVAAE